MSYSIDDQNRISQLIKASRICVCEDISTVGGGPSRGSGANL